MPSDLTITINDLAAAKQTMRKSIELHNKEWNVQVYTTKDDDQTGFHLEIAPFDEYYQFDYFTLKIKQIPDDDDPFDDADHRVYYAEDLSADPLSLWNFIQGITSALGPDDGIVHFLEYNLSVFLPAYKNQEEADWRIWLLLEAVCLIVLAKKATGDESKKQQQLLCTNMTKLGGLMNLLNVNL